MKRTRKIIGVAVAMMWLLAVSTAPAMACPCDEGDNVVGNPGVGDPIELTAVEKSKVVGIALKNSQVKKIQKQLNYEGFTQKYPEAFTIPVEAEDGLKTEVLVVAIPFQKDKSENGKTIAYVHNPQTGESISVLIDGPITIKGFTDCSIYLAVCLVIAVGCSIPCAAVLVPDPFELAEIKACLICIASAGVVCREAYCECSEWVCDEGYQEFCDNCDN